MLQALDHLPILIRQLELVTSFLVCSRLMQLLARVHVLAHLYVESVQPLEVALPLRITLVPPGRYR